MEKAQTELTEISKAAGTMTGANLVGPNGQPISANPEVRQNVLLGPQRKVHFRSFVETSPMGSDLIQYPQFTGSEGDFDTQANQGDLKEQLEEKFEMENAIAYTVAGFYVVSKQSLSDIPWLLDSILAKGTERYYKAEDRKMFYGSGLNDIKGLKNIVPEFTGEMPNMYEALLNGVMELIDTDYDANGIVLRPMNYAQLLKYKTNTGEYNMPMLFMPNQQFPMSIAGVPLIMSTAVNFNDSFTGDWSAENLRMLIREGLNIEFAYQDADNFRRNLVTIRLESRVGLEVDYPEAIRYIDLANIAAVI
jgi:HK97 family phage major capsid protein